MKRFLQKNKMHKYFQEIMSIKKSPHSIALGFAIGTGIAVLPTPGIGIFAGLLVIFLFKKVNKISLFGAMLIFNPLILAPIYYLSYQLGNWLLGNAPKQEFEVSLYNIVYHLSGRFLMGNIIISVVISFASYFLVKYIAQKYQKKQPSHS